MNNNLFKIQKNKKIRFSKRKNIFHYSEKDFKNVNFSKFIVNTKIKDIENILLGVFMNQTDLFFKEYP